MGVGRKGNREGALELMGKKSLQFHHELASCTVEGLDVKLSFSSLQKNNAIMEKSYSQDSLLLLAFSLCG